MPRINYKHSEETKRKIGLGNRGKKRSPANFQKLNSDVFEYLQENFEVDRGDCVSIAVALQKV